MTMDTAQHHAIVVGVDGSQSAMRAAHWAAREAQERNAPLLLLHAQLIPRVPHAFQGVVAPNYRNGMLASGYELLGAAWQTCLEAAPDVRYATQLKVASPAATLIGASHRARMVVLGSRGLGGISGLLLGSVAAAVATQAECPVVVVRGVDERESGRPVVVGVDGSSVSEAAVAFAFDAAAHRDVPLIAVHARPSVASGGWPAPIDSDDLDTEANLLLSEQLAGWREKYADVEIRHRVATGRPAPELVGLSGAAQLVVVGSHGRGSLAALGLGSVSHALLNHSRCPVAVARARPADA